MPLNVFDWVPMRWPESWGTPQYRKFPHGPINCLVVDDPSPDLIAAYEADGVAVTSLKDAGVALVQGCKWPQVRTGGSDGADAGPTGVPWIDANGYLVQLARALHPDQPVWLDYGPAPKQGALTADMHRLAICDAAAYGGHWIIRPDSGLLPVMAKTAAFFVDHKVWQAYRPIAKLAVVADFAGPSRALEVEVLNLLPRRRVPYAVIPGARVEATDLSAFAAVLWIGRQPKKYGGISITPQSDDPFQTAVETHMRMGRRNDLLRLWNDGSMNAFYTASPDGREHLVQLINYSAASPSDAVTLGLARSYKSATLYTLDDEPKEITIRPVRAGIEIQLPPFPVYAAISLR
jgi:hypothetical protein